MAVALLCVPLAALAQVIPNNSFASMLDHSNTMLQGSMKQIITNQARTNAQAGLGQGQGTPNPALAGHLPITLTDFVPVLPGHPFIDQHLATAPLTPQERAAVLKSVNSTYVDLSDGKHGRPNNLATALFQAINMAKSTLRNCDLGNPDANLQMLLRINDRLAAAPQMATMSAGDKQALSEMLIFQASLFSMACEMAPGTHAADKAQAIQMAHNVLQQLTGSPDGGAL
jgi:hypothetical protein